MRVRKGKSRNPKARGRARPSHWGDGTWKMGKGIVVRNGRDVDKLPLTKSTKEDVVLILLVLNPVQAQGQVSGSGIWTYQQWKVIERMETYC